MREIDLLRQKAASTRHRLPRNPISGPRCQPYWKESSIGKPENCPLLPIHCLQLSQRNGAFKSHKDNNGLLKFMNAIENEEARLAAVKWCRKVLGVCYQND